MAITLTMLRRSSLAISIIRWLNSRRSGVNGVREPELSFDVTRPKDRGHWPGLCWVILAVAHGSYLDGGWSLIKKTVDWRRRPRPDVKMNSIATHSRPSSSYGGSKC